MIENCKLKHNKTKHNESELEIKIAYYKTTEHRQATDPPTGPQITHRPPITDHRFSDCIRTDSPATDPLTGPPPIYRRTTILSGKQSKNKSVIHGIKIALFF